MRMLHLKKIVGALLPAKKIVLDERELRKAGIGVLIEEERWDRLFSSVEKTPSIIKTERILRDCLDEKTRLRMESNMLKAEKQAMLDRIIELTGAADNGDHSIYSEIEECDSKISDINEREPLIERRNVELDVEIKANNYALLEEAVPYLYRYMKKSQARVADLDERIDDMRNNLKARIDERAGLAESVDETYNFLHGLLGAKQIESLDMHYTLD